MLNKLLKVSIEWGVIDRMPCTIKLSKVSSPEVKFYDFDEYERLVEAAKRVDQRAFIAVLLGGEAGLRPGEMIALEQTDVDYRRGFLTVQRAEWQGKIGLPKGGRIRRIPLTQRLANALLGHKHLRGPRVLYRDDGSTITRHVLRNWLEQAERRAELPQQGAIHILRRTFCSHRR